MGAKTLSQFTTDLKFELGRSVDTSLDDYYTGWINTAYTSLTTRHKFFGERFNLRFPELEDEHTASCTAGDTYVLAHANCLYIQEVWDSTNDARLRNISWREYNSITGRNTTASRNKPTKWVQRGKTGSYKRVYISPTPAGAYGLVLFDRRRATALADDDDTTVIGAEWDEPILQLAVLLTHSRLNEFDRIEPKKPEWIEMMTDVAGIYDKEELARKDVRSPSLSYIERPYG